MSDTIDVPSLDDGQKLLARFAKIAAAADGHEADLEAAIAVLKKAADRKIAPIAAERIELKAKLEAWWAAHGATFTLGKKKSHELAGCVIGSRSNPKKLLFAEGDDDAAIAALRVAGFHTLVRKVPQLDKKAIMARLEAKTSGLQELGFSVKQGETFFVDLATRSRKP
jgi:phage host-nuclease inhibitor protein Gam